MNEEKEVKEHLHALVEWASKDKKRVAFVICGEITDDGVEAFNALAGRRDRIARTLLATAMEVEIPRQLIMIAAKAIENPLAARILCMRASETEKSFESNRDFYDSLRGLLDTIMVKLRKK